MCINTERRTVEINWDENGIEFNLGELRVLSLYFMKGDKFWSQLQFILKSQIQSEEWLKMVIYQQFVDGWINEPFTIWYWKRTGLPPYLQ